MKKCYHFEKWATRDLCDSLEDLSATIASTSQLKAKVVTALRFGQIKGLKRIYCMVKLVKISRHLNRMNELFDQAYREGERRLASDYFEKL